MTACSGVPINKCQVQPSTIAEAYSYCAAAQMLMLARGKPAQVPLLNALPADVAGTCLHAGALPSPALGAVTSKQEATMSINRGRMLINREDLEEVFSLQKFALQTDSCATTPSSQQRQELQRRQCQQETSHYVQL